MTLHQFFLYSLVSLIPFEVVSGEEPDEETTPYYLRLLEHPVTGYDWERFVTTWCTRGTADGLEAYLKAKIHEGDDQEHKLLLAYFYGHQKDYVESLQQLSRILKDEPDNSTIWLEKAKIELATENPDEALHDLEKALENDPVDSSRIGMAMLQGSLLSKNSQAAKAMEVWEALLLQFPDNDRLRESLIERQVASGFLDDAIESAMALRNRTKDPDAWGTRTLRLGNLYAMGDDRAKAILMYETCVNKVDVSDWIREEAVSHIEALFRRRNDARGLQVYLTKMIKDSPELASLKVRQAELSMELGDHQFAQNIWETLLSEARETTDYLDGYVSALTAMGKEAEILPRLSELIRSNKARASRMLDLAQRFHYSGDTERFEEAIDVYLQLSNRSASANSAVERLMSQKISVDITPTTKQAGFASNIALVEELKQAREWIGAAKAMEAALLPEERTAAHAKEIAHLYHQAFDGVNALKWVGEWRRLSPDDASACKAEADLLTWAGRFDEEAECLQRAIDLFPTDNSFVARLVESPRFARFDGFHGMRWRLYDQAESLIEQSHWVTSMIQKEWSNQNRIPYLIGLFEELAERNPHSIEPLNALATLYEAAENTDLRNRMLLEARRIDPQNVELWHKCARISEMENRWSEARRILAAILKHDTTLATRKLLIKNHFASGNRVRGMILLAELSAESEITSTFIGECAQEILMTQDWHQARSFLAPYVAAHPDHPQLSYLYGVALEEEGNTKAATEVYLKLLTVERQLPKQEASVPDLIQYSIMERIHRTDEINQIAPLGVIDLIDQMIGARLAYAYKDPGDGRFRFLENARTRSGDRYFPNPPSVNDLRRWSISHLRECALTLDENEKAQLDRRLVDLGVRHPRLVLTPKPSLSNSVEVAEDDLDDVDVMGAFLLEKTLFSNRSLSLLLKIYQKLRQEYPELALIAAFEGFLMDSAGMSATFDEALALLEVSEPSSDLARLLNEVLAKTIREASSRVSTAQQDLIFDALERWEDALDDYVKGQTVVYRATVLRQKEEMGPFVSLLDSKIGWFRETMDARGMGWRANELLETSVNRTIRMGGSRGRSPLAQVITALTFQDSLVSIDRQIRDLIFDVNPNGYPLNIEGLRKVIGSIQDPALRAAFAYSCNAKDQAKAILEETLTQDDSVIDALVMSGALFLEENQLPHTVERWVKARALVKSPEIAMILDNSILSIALRAEAGEGVREQGILAAKRLQHMPNADRYREEIASGLTRLNPEEKDEEMAAPPTANRPRVSRILPPVGAPSFPRSQNNDTGNEEDPEKALESVIRQLDAYAARALVSSPGHGAIPPTAALQWIRSQLATDKILKQIDPGDSTNWNQLAKFAVICQLLDRKEMALSMFKKALQLQPKNKILIIHMFLLEAEQDIVSAMDLLPGIHADQMAAIGDTICHRASNLKEMESKIEVAQKLTEYLRGLKQTDNLDVSWAHPFIKVIGGSHYTQEENAYSVYGKADRDAEIDAEDIERFATKEDLRRRAFEDLCRVMNQIPKLSRVGFGYLAALPPLKGEAPNDYTELAKETLLKEESLAPGRIQEVDSLPFYDAEDYLAETSWKSGTVDRMVNDYVPLLVERGRVETAKSLEQRLELYTCDADRFEELASASVMTVDPRGRAIVSFQRMCRMIDIWNERKIELNLNPLFLRILNSENNRSFIYPWIVYYGEVLGERADAQEIEVFLEMLAEFYLGPESERHEFIAQFHNPEGNSRPLRSVEDRLIFAYLYGMAELSRSEVLAFPIFNELKRYGFNKRHQRDHYFQYLLYAFQNQELMGRMLSHSPFIGTIDSFRPIELPYLPKATYFSSLLEFVNQDPSAKEFFRKYTRSIIPPTFGAELIIAFLDDDVNRVAECLSEHAEDLLQLPDGQRQEFMLMINERYPSDVNLSGLSKAAREFIERCRFVEDPELEAQLDAILSNRGPRLALGNIAEEHVRNLTDYLVRRKEGARIRALWEAHVRSRDEKLESYALRNPREWQSQRSDEEQTAAGDLLRVLYPQTVIDEGVVSFQKLGVALDMIGSTMRGRQIEVDHAILEELVEPLRRYNEKRMAEGDGANDKREVFKSFYGTLREAIGDRPCSVMGPCLSALFYEIDHQLITELIPWLKSQSHPVATELEMAARIWLSFGIAPLPNDVPRVEQQYYLDIINNPDLPLAWRMATGESLLGIKGLLPHDDLRLAMASLLAESWRTPSVTVRNLQANLCLNAFALMANRDQDSWRLVGRQLVESWMHYRREGGYSVMNTSQLRRTLSLLKVCLRIDSKELTTGMVAQFEKDLTRDPKVLILLIAYGEFELAERLLTDGWALVHPAYDNYQYTADVEKQTEAWLNAIDSNDIKLLGEVIIKCAPDPSEGPQPKVRRSERVKLLLEAAPAWRFANPLIEERCLSLLTRLQHSAEPFFPE